MLLTTESGGTTEVTTVEDLARQLRMLNAECNTFAILSSSDEVYIQTALRNGSYEVEKREGTETAHFEAVRPGPSSFDLNRRFMLPEVIELFTAYYKAEPTRLQIDWKPLRLPQFPRKISWIVAGGFLLAVVVGIALIVWDQIELIRQVLAS